MQFAVGRRFQVPGNSLPLPGANLITGPQKRHIRTSRPREARAASLEATEQLNERSDGRRENGHNLQARDLAVKEAHGEVFNWLKAWYPVAIESDLPADRPKAIRLLGNALVLWKDGEGKWRAFKDLCPHRLAPLSEGRVENGELMCSYHGWQFRGSDGRTTVIPQADDQKSLATAVSSKRSCCAVHPCAVDDGLVWVYGSSNSGAEEESQAVPRPLLPKLADGSCTQLTPWFTRELPYGADVLCENVIDPAHVPFSHHGYQGNRFEVTKMAMDAAKEVDPQKGFTVYSYATEPVPEGSLRIAYDLSFLPPSCIRYQYSSGAELVSHAVPLDPGRSRIFFTLLVPKAKVKGILTFILKLKASKPLRWVEHLTRNNVLDGDNVFLAFQDQELQRRQSAEASKNYFMPASLDFGVKALREWYLRMAEPLPWGAGARSPTAAVGQSRRQMLDRYEQHTKDCPSCAAAHKTFSFIQWAGAFAAVFAGAYTAFALGNGTPLRKLILPTLATALTAALAFVSRDYRQKMEFLDYRHPDH